MTEIVKSNRRKAIEPTSIDKLKPGERFSLESEQVSILQPPEPPSRNPNWYMRALGYWANPGTCIHNRKTFKTRWICSDCGVDL